MKKKAYSLIICCLLFSTTTYAQWWKELGRAIVGAAGAVVISNTVEKYGGEEYGNREKAEQFTRDLYDFIGADQKNAEAGIAWNNAENNYQKANIAKEYAFNAYSQISENPETVEFLRRMTETELNYFDDKLKSNSEDDRLAAIDRRALAWANITYDMKEAHDQKTAAKRMQERLQMEEQLRGIRGEDYNDEEITYATDFIIATVQSEELSEEEKETCLKNLGLSQSPKEIITIVTPLLNEDNEAEIRRQEELKRQREEERRLAEERRIAEQRAAEERKQALENLSSIIIDGFAFDETQLSESQKYELNEAACILNKYSEVKVLLTGHTCKIGYKNINLKKGLKRAEAVKEYLVLQGVDSGRIEIDSRGETEPLVPNTSPENYKQNRRVEIQIK